MNLFTIPLWADLLAVGIGSVQGAAFAAQFRDRRLDLLGVALIGIATGFGGGVIRDVLLNQIPAALQSNWYLPVATVAALLGMLLERIVRRLGVAIAILDALTIGLFGAIGTTKALADGLPVVPADLRRRDRGRRRVDPARPAARACRSRSCTSDRSMPSPRCSARPRSQGLIALGVPVPIAAIVCVVITFTVRVLAVVFHWTLPEQKPLDRISLVRPTRAVESIRSADRVDASGRPWMPQGGAMSRCV